MAYKYIGLDNGLKASEITVSDSSTSKAVEISIDLAKVTDKGVIASVIETLEAYIATTLPVA